MAIIKAISSHAPINIVIDYITQKEKTDGRLITGFGCSPESAKEEMQSTKELYGKTDGRTYKHFVQSFAPDEKIDYQTAHEIATKLVERTSCFNGYEVLVATHQDRNHVHSHFVVNSVSYEDGKKFQMSSKDLQRIKDISDGLCREYGLSICEKGCSFDGTERKNIVAWTKEKYQYLKSILDGEKGNSYICSIRDAVSESMQTAKSVDEFKKELENRGVTAKWKDTRKNITYIDSNGKKVRDTNLKKTFNLNADKESLLKQFEINKEKAKESPSTDFQKKRIVSQYKIIVYKEVQDALINQINGQKQVIENIYGKTQKAEASIRNIEKDMRKWETELGKCSKMQFSKKYELQEKIEHGKMLIETISEDRDVFISNYGFSSVEDLKIVEDEVKEAKELAEKIEVRVESEREILKSYLDMDYKYQSLDENAIISAREELREMFEKDFDEGKFQTVLEDINPLEQDSREMEGIGETRG